MCILRYTWRPGKSPNRSAHSKEEVILGLKSKNIARERRNAQRHLELSTPKE